MIKERVRLSLDLSKNLYNQVKVLANNLDLTVTGVIRIAIQEYLKQLKGEETHD